MQRAIMCELSVYMLKRYFMPFFVNTREQLISKSLLQKKMGKTKRKPTSIDFFSIYDFLRFFIQHPKWSQKHKRTYKKCV